jgi:hypothetical protein
MLNITQKLLSSLLKNKRICGFFLLRSIEESKHQQQVLIKNMMILVSEYLTAGFEPTTS